jgi:hypothetical protein
MRKIWTLISSRRGRSVAAVLILAIFGVGAVNLDHRTVRQRAAAWAQAHANALPSTLEDIAAYPAEYRQAIFEALPAAEKSRLWQIQLQHVLDTERLTADQRAFVVNVKAMATPTSFLKDMPKPEICPDVARLFTNPAQKEKVRAIAEGVTPARSFSAAWVKTSERVRSAVSLTAAQFDCSCRGLGLCECGLTSGCLDGDCNQTQTCGCIWSGTCDKMCMAPLPNMNSVTKK